MVANATYPAFDDEQPAALSRRIVSGILRDQLAFQGVVITDDLGAGAITGAGYDEGEAAIAAREGRRRPAALCALSRAKPRTRP